MKLLVVGSLRNVTVQPELCAAFVEKLAEQIVERGHTLLNGCRGSVDKATAEAADARLRALGRSSDTQLLGYRLQDAEPVHRLGTIRISERTDWDLTHPQLIPPEQFGEADAAIFVAGGQGTFIAANWARIAGVPVLGVAQFGGAGRELYAYEKAQIDIRFRRSITLDEFAVLNQDTTNIAKLAADVVALAERIVLPRTVFPILSFATPYQDVKDSFESSCREAGFELRGTGEEATTERIIPRILDGIRRAAFVIADISDVRPNVFYEIGFAQGLGKQVILTAKTGTALPFDMVDIPVLFWDTQRSLRDQLTTRLRSMPGAPPAPLSSR
jgi:hypothetical protein